MTWLTRRAPASVGVLLAAAALAACSSSPSSSGSSTTTTSKSSKSGSTTTVPPKPFFTESGSGNKQTKSFTATSKWLLQFHYTCVTLGHKGHFTLTLHPSSGSPVKVTTQEGEGGGGARAFQAGTFTLQVTTPCTWGVSATHDG
jgi:hypothetical protein